MPLREGRDGILGPEEMSPTCDIFSEARNADINVPNISQKEVSTAMRYSIISVFIASIRIVNKFSALIIFNGS